MKRMMLLKRHIQGDLMVCETEVRQGNNRTEGKQKLKGIIQTQPQSPSPPTLSSLHPSSLLYCYSKYNCVFVFKWYGTNLH